MFLFVLRLHFRKSLVKLQENVGPLDVIETSCECPYVIQGFVT